MASNPAGSSYDFGIYRKWNGHDLHANDRKRRERLGIPALCARCERGEHWSRHGDSGCLVLMGPERGGRDYLCRCTVPRIPGTGHGRALERRLRSALRAVSKP